MSALLLLIIAGLLFGFAPVLATLAGGSLLVWLFFKAVLP